MGKTTFAIVATALLATAVPTGCSSHASNASPSSYDALFYNCTYTQTGFSVGGASATIENGCIGSLSTTSGLDGTTEIYFTVDKNGSPFGAFDLTIPTTATAGTPLNIVGSLSTDEKTAAGQALLTFSADTTGAPTYGYSGTLTASFTVQAPTSPAEGVAGPLAATIDFSGVVASTGGPAISGSLTISANANGSTASQNGIGSSTGGSGETGDQNSCPGFPTGCISSSEDEYCPTDCSDGTIATTGCCVKGTGTVVGSPSTPLACSCAYGGTSSESSTKCSGGDLSCESSGACCPPNLPYYSTSTRQCYDTVADACAASNGACPLQCL
jgi:hypothetical protein